VQLGTVFAHDVFDADPEHSKRIRDEERWQRQSTASAHINALRFCPANLISLVTRVEFRGLHVVGKSTKRAIAPPYVRRIASRVAQATELSQVHVADPRGPQLCAQDLLVELRIVS